MNAIAPPCYDTDQERWAALRTRDRQADSHFLYSVATTGVYCRPSCAARPARPENVGFHADRESAELAGFRPCKRCKPDQPPRAQREASLVAQACRAIEAADETPGLEQLATVAGFSTFHFHRLFRRVAGVTPKAYADAVRTRRVQERLLAGSSVTSALYEAGFNSSGRFYAAADGMLGMTPAAYRQGAPGEVIRYATGSSALGLVLVAATPRGICAILLGDDPAALELDLQSRFPRARLQPAGEDFNNSVLEVITHLERPAGHLDLPLDIQGTAFQRRVWEVLRSIPAGHTLSYGEVAAQLGQPAAVRAVASACGANSLAVAIPCHRVVGKTGALSGYRWGIERKRALLAREQGM